MALFLFIFLSVLGVNYRFNVKVAEDLTTLNLTGAQRALSQRIARSVLQLQEQARGGAPSAGTLKELRDSVEVFEATLTVFDQGGQTRRLDDGAGVDLERLRARLVARLAFGGAGGRAHARRTRSQSLPRGLLDLRDGGRGQRPMRGA